MAIIKFVAAGTLLLHASSVLAIDLGGPIVGCTAVDCPSASNSTSADCRVADRKSTVIGLANFHTSLGKDDFTWSEGVTTYDNVDPQVEHDRIYEKNFYLGLPLSFDLTTNATGSGYGACALFFTKVTDRVKFGGNDSTTSVGTCNDALSADCVNALLKQATEASGSFNKSSTADACKRLQSAFSDNLAPQCPQFATGDNWQGLEVKDLTGSDASKPLTDAENSTSNCYPTLPKSNSLTHVAAFNTSGTSVADSVVANLFSITPILTVFFPQNQSNAAVVHQPEAQLTCLKAVDGTDASNKTANDGAKDKDSAAVMPLRPNFAASSLLIALSMVVFFF